MNEKKQYNSNSGLHRIQNLPLYIFYYVLFFGAGLGIFCDVVVPKASWWRNYELSLPICCGGKKK